MVAERDGANARRNRRQRNEVLWV